jgi:hypothetical protein
MWHGVDMVLTDVSEERIASIPEDCFLNTGNVGLEYIPAGYYKRDQVNPIRSNNGWRITEMVVVLVRK